jgi:spore cortex protein
VLKKHSFFKRLLFKWGVLRLRKSLVSLSAAALMVVGLTGCGANDNNFDTYNNNRDARILDRGYHNNNNNNDLNYRGYGDTIDNEGPITEMMDGDDNNRNILNNDNGNNNRGFRTNDRNGMDRDTFGTRGNRMGGQEPTGTGTGGTR